MTPSRKFLDKTLNEHFEYMFGELRRRKSDVRKLKKEVSQLRDQIEELLRRLQSGLERLPEVLETLRDQRGSTFNINVKLRPGVTNEVTETVTETTEVFTRHGRRGHKNSSRSRSFTPHRSQHDTDSDHDRESVQSGSDRSTHQPLPALEERIVSEVTAREGTSSSDEEEAVDGNKQSALSEKEDDVAFDFVGGHEHDGADSCEYRTMKFH